MLEPRTFTVDSTARPCVSVAPGTSREAIVALTDLGYIVETGERSDGYAVHLGRVENARLCHHRRVPPRDRRIEAAAGALRRVAEGMPLRVRRHRRHRRAHHLGLRPALPRVVRRSLAHGMNPRIVIVSEDLVEPWDEGIKKFAYLDRARALRRSSRAHDQRGPRRRGVSQRLARGAGGRRHPRGCATRSCAGTPHVGIHDVPGHAHVHPARAAPRSGLVRSQFVVYVASPSSTRWGVFCAPLHCGASGRSARSRDGGADSAPAHARDRVLLYGHRARCRSSCRRMRRSCT